MPKLQTCFKASYWTNPAALLIPTVRSWLFKKGIAAPGHFGSLGSFHEGRVKILLGNWISTTVLTSIWPSIRAMYGDMWIIRLIYIYNTFIFNFHLNCIGVGRSQRKLTIWGLNTSDLGWSAYTKRSKQHLRFWDVNFCKKNTRHYKSSTRSPTSESKLCKTGKELSVSHPVLRDAGGNHVERSMLAAKPCRQTLR